MAWGSRPADGIAVAGHGPRPGASSETGGERYSRFTERHRLRELRMGFSLTPRPARNI